LLEVERVSHNSGLSGDSIPRVVQPAVTEDGKKSPGLKFGQPRVMTLFLALTLFHHLIDGFRNHDLRQHVADLLGVSVAEYIQPDDLRLAAASAQRPDLPAAQNQPLLCHALGLEGRAALLPPGCPRIPARDGDVHRQRRCSTVSTAERSRPRRRPTGRTHLPSFSSSKGRLKNITLSERSHLHQTARGIWHADRTH
jgi:hypothetical protein